jgi:hypothetical protein
MGYEIEKLRNQIIVPSEKKFFKESEVFINQFLKKVEEKKVLKKKITEFQSVRLVNITTTVTYARDLVNNFHKIYFDKDVNKIECKEYFLEQIGFKTSPYHYFTVICHGYQVISELLKIHLIAIINFQKMEKLKVTNQDKAPLGTIINSLNSNFKDDKFVKKLSSTTRNAVSHYTYYYNKNQFNFCKGVFDKEPTPMTLEEFFITSRKLDILTNLLFAIYSDEYWVKEQ